MTETRFRYKSIDDYLGPAESRFFGCGHRRAEYRVGDVAVTPAAEPGAGARTDVTVSYPADWSRKGDNVDLRPHLSSVDLLVLGVQLSETHLTHAYGLDEAMRRAMWLRKVTLRAGATPQEDLVGLSGSATLRQTRPGTDTSEAFVSVYDCAIGSMQARCEIEHAIVRRVPDGGTYTSIEDVLGTAGSRYYGDGFKFRQQRIEDVRVDMAELRSTATVWIEPIPGAVPLIEGIEGDYQPAVSAIDCFVVNLQLAQILMYEMDSVRRQDSNTLWMLKTVLEASSPHRPCSRPLETQAAITGKHLVPLRRGMWRNVEVQGACGGMTLRSSFAHELPPAARPI